MNRFALIAAIVTLAGTAAFAENLKGTVPFDFNAAGVDLPAGKYEILRQGENSTIWLLQNTSTGKKIAIMSPGSTVGRAASESRGPALAFRCISDSCALQALYESGKTAGYAFRVHLPSAADVQVATTRTIQFAD